MMTGNGVQGASWLLFSLLAGCSGSGDFGETVDHVTQAVDACSGVRLELSQISPLLQGEPVTLTAETAGCSNPRYAFSVRAANADGTWTPWAGLQRGPTATFGPVAYLPGRYQFRVRAKEKGMLGFQFAAKRRFEWCGAVGENGTCIVSRDQQCEWWDRDVLGVGDDPMFASGGGGRLVIVAGTRIRRRHGAAWERISRPDVGARPLRMWQAPDGPLFLALAHDPLPCDQPEDCTGGSTCSEGVCEPTPCQLSQPPPYGESCLDCPPGYVAWAKLSTHTCVPGFSVWRHEGAWEQIHRNPLQPLQVLGSTSTNVFWLQEVNGSLGGKLWHFDGNTSSIYLPTGSPNGTSFLLKGQNPVYSTASSWHEYPSDGDPISLPSSSFREPIFQLGPAAAPQVLYFRDPSDPKVELGTIDGWTDVTDPGQLDDVLGGVWPHIVQRTGNDVSRFDGAEWSTVTITPPGDLVAERMVLMDDVSTIGVITSTHVGICEAFAGDTP